MAGGRGLRGRVSYERWRSRFAKLATNDSEASKVLQRWAFFGAWGDELPLLLYFYVCGAPSASQFRIAFKPSSDLAEQMDAMSSALRKFDSRREAAAVGRNLQALGVAIGHLRGRSERLDEIYANL